MLYKCLFIIDFIKFSNMILAAMMYGGTCTLNLKAYGWSLWGGLDLSTNHHQGWNPSSLASFSTIVINSHTIQSLWHRWSCLCLIFPPLWTNLSIASTSYTLQSTFGLDVSTKWFLLVSPEYPEWRSPLCWCCRQRSTSSRVCWLRLTVLKISQFQRFRGSYVF